MEKFLVSRDEALNAAGGINRHLFDRMVSDGKLPPPVRLGRRVLWSAAALREAIERLADEGAA